MNTTKSNFISTLKDRKGILILGHRGCRKSEVVENTLPAFRKALDAGADGIEIDVETTSDGSLVVINRWFANKELNFFPWERTLKTIQACGRETGIAVPTFTEVCELIASYPDSVFNVEIKSSDRYLCQTAKKVGRIIHRFGFGHRVIISSFDMNTLLTMKRHYSELETAYLFRREDRVADIKEKGTLKYKVNGFINRSGIKAVLTGSDTLHPEIGLVSENKKALWQKYARLASKRINCWTVDSEADFMKALKTGADVVISDDPFKAMEYRKNRLK